MNVWIEPVPVLSLLVASLLALFACVRIFRRERRRARKMAVREVQSRLGGVDFKTSAWLVGIPRTHAGKVQEKASRVAKDAGPEDVLALWEAEGGVLLGRVAGPSFSTEDEASAWVERASDKLAEAPVAWPEADQKQSVFAMAHASAADPPARAASLRDLQGVFGPDCVGVAFVACPVGDRRQEVLSLAMEGQLAASQGTLRALSGARFGLGAVAVLAAGYAGAALASSADGWSVQEGRGPQARGCMDTPPHGSSGVHDGPRATPAGSETGAMSAQFAESGAGAAGQTTSTTGDTGTTAGQTTSSGDTVTANRLNTAEDDAGSADAGPSDAGSPDAGDGASAGQGTSGKGTSAGQGTSGKGTSAGQGISGKGTSAGQGTSGHGGPANKDGDTYDSPAKSAAPPQGQ